MTGRRERSVPPSPAVRGEVAALLRGVADGRVTRRQFVARAGALGLSLSAVGTLLAACGGSDTAASPAAPAFPTTKPATLNVHNWSGYMAPKVIKQFEADQGIKIKLTEFDSTDQCVKQIKQGGAYDVIFPEAWGAEILIKAGLLTPLDMSLLPNFKNVTQPTFQKPPYDPGTDGKKYTSVYFFGTMAFAVRLDKIATPQQSWEMLFDPKYKQKISMLDGSRDVLGPPLWMAGTDPNTTDQAQIDAATQKLIEQKPLVTVYSSTGTTDRLIAGLPVVQCWDGDAAYVMNKLGLEKCRYILPAEGYSVWADAPCVPTAAASPYGAHLLLNYLLDPAVAAANANFTGYQPVVEAADPMIKSLVQRALRPTTEQLEVGTFNEDLGEAAAIYDAAYAKVLKA
jgi:spermidine/putrescine transport system substrate-binding protein